MRLRHTEVFHAVMQAGPAQTVRLAATPALGQTVLPAAMARWHKAAPGSRCALSKHRTRELVNALLPGEAEMALSLHGPRHPGIGAAVLASAPVAARVAALMAALVPIRSAAARLSGLLHVEDLPLEMIGLEVSDPIGQRVLAECEALGTQPQMRITVQTDPLAPARALAEAGLGVVQ